MNVTDTGHPEAERDRSRHERFLELLRPHQASLSRFARAMTRDAESARDLISETVLKAFENFDKIKDHQSFLSYLFTIAVRTHQRDAKRQARFSNEELESFASHRATTPSPEVAVDVRILYEALAQLPEKQREAVIMFEIAGLSLEEIRVIQGGSLSGVKSRIARGREALGDLLGVHADRKPESITISRLDTNRTATRSFLAVSAEVKR